MRRRWPSAARWPWPWRGPRDLGFESRFRTNKSNVRSNNKDEELGGDVGVGDGGGRVVNVLAFYSDDPSSNSADVYIFCKMLFE